MNKQMIHDYKQMCDLNRECDIFYSFLGDIGLWRGRWKDDPLDCVILINNPDEIDENNDW